MPKTKKSDRQWLEDCCKAAYGEITEFRGRQTPAQSSKWYNCWSGVISCPYRGKPKNCLAVMPFGDDQKKQTTLLGLFGKQVVRSIQGGINQYKVCTCGLHFPYNQDGSPCNAAAPSQDKVLLWPNQHMAQGHAEDDPNRGDEVIEDVDDAAGPSRGQLAYERMSIVRIVTDKELKEAEVNIQSSRAAFTQEVATPDFTLRQHYADRGFLRGAHIKWIEAKLPYTLDLLVWCPLTGQCLACGGGGQGNIDIHGPGRSKLCYATPWPFLVQSPILRCKMCKQGTFSSTNPAYVATLPSQDQLQMPFLQTDKSNGVSMPLIHLLRYQSVAFVQRYIRQEVEREYWKQRTQFEGSRLSRMWSPQVVYPGFPSSFAPSDKPLMRLFVYDYHLNREGLRRELAAQKSQITIKVDHMRQAAKRAKGKEVVGGGGQTFTVIGDLGILLGVYCVPDTGGEWLEDAMWEVIGRHLQVPPILYVDSGCCNGKLKSRSETNVAKKAIEGGSNRRWRDQFKHIKLDAMHLMMRMTKQINTGHPRKAQLCRDLSKAILQESPGDLKAVRDALQKAGLDRHPTATERKQFIRSIIGDGEQTRYRVLVTVKKHMELDRDAVSRVNKPGVALGPADMGYPLITKSFLAQLHNQLVHIRNGCLQDPAIESNGTEQIVPPYIQTSTVNFRNTGDMLPVFQSLRGTSQVESFHSVLAGNMHPYNHISMDVFDARLSWWVQDYNRTRSLRAGLLVPPLGISPRDAALYGASYKQMYPDFHLAPANSILPKIGFEYAKYVTNQGYKPGFAVTEVEDVVDNLQDGDLSMALFADTAIVQAYSKAPQDTEDFLEDEAIDQVGVQQEENVSQSQEELTKASVELEQELFANLEDYWKRPRNVTLKRNLTKQIGAVPPTFNEEVKDLCFQLLRDAIKMHRDRKQLVKAVRDQYESRRLQLIKGAADAGQPIPSLLPLDYGTLSQWVNSTLDSSNAFYGQGTFSATARTITTSLGHHLRPSLSAVQALSKPTAQLSLFVAQRQQASSSAAKLQPPIQQQGRLYPTPALPRPAIRLVEPAIQGRAAVKPVAARPTPSKGKEPAAYGTWSPVPAIQSVAAYPFSSRGKQPAASVREQTPIHEPPQVTPSPQMPGTSQPPQKKARASLHCKKCGKPWSEGKYFNLGLENKFIAHRRLGKQGYFCPFTDSVEDFVRITSELQAERRKRKAECERERRLRDWQKLQEACEKNLEAVQKQNSTDDI